LPGKDRAHRDRRSDRYGGGRRGMAQGPLARQGKCAAVHHNECAEIPEKEQADSTLRRWPDRSHRRDWAIRLGRLLSQTALGYSPFFGWKIVAPTVITEVPAAGCLKRCSATPASITNTPQTRDSTPFRNSVTF